MNPFIKPQTTTLPRLRSGMAGSASINLLLAAIEAAYGGGALVETLPDAGDNPGRVMVDLSQAGVAASLETALTGTDNDIKLTAREAGAAGNSITITLADPSANDAALSVEVDGTDITVNLATGPAGAITSTAQEVMDAINADDAANDLVLVTLKSGNDGSGVVTALASDSLENGDDPIGVPVISDGSVWRPINGGTYTVATAPDPTSMPGACIYVSDGAAGSPCAAVSNGTNWLRITLGAAIAGA